MSELHLPWRVDPGRPWLVYDASGNRVTGRGSHGMSVTLAQMEHLVRAANGVTEHPADDAEPVTQEWLGDVFGRHLAGCSWKRYALHIATDRYARTIGWCPPCGQLQPLICIDEWAFIENPTRGQVRRLLAALGLGAVP